MQLEKAARRVAAAPRCYLITLEANYDRLKKDVTAVPQVEHDCGVFIVDKRITQSLLLCVFLTRVPRIWYMSLL